MTTPEEKSDMLMTADAALYFNDDCRHWPISGQLLTDPSAANCSRPVGIGPHHGQRRRPGLRLPQHRFRAVQFLSELGADRDPATLRKIREANQALRRVLGDQKYCEQVRQEIDWFGRLK